MNEPDRLPSPDHPAFHHETSDVNPIPIGWFALALAITVVVVAAILHGMFWRLEQSARRSDGGPNEQAGSQRPPEPRLQVQPAEDLVTFQHREERQLTRYGWIGQERKAVHIPVTRAIGILAKRGFPEPEGENLAPQQERVP